MQSPAYFDNAATTFPKPECVYQFMDSFYRNFGVNVGRGGYAEAVSAAAMMKETRDLLLRLFHAPAKRAIFQPTATEALNLILRGLPWRDGMTVYLSPFEHNAVTRPLHYLSREYQLRITELSVNRASLEYRTDEIKRQFQARAPDVVILTHASNVCGLIAPLGEIFREAKKYQAVTVADLSQTAGLLDVDLTESFADYAVFAGHKTLYGPFGASGFLAPAETNLEPLIYGGTGVESANPFMPDMIPEKYEAGSHNIQAIAGLNAALQWIFSTGVEKIREREARNKTRLLDILNAYPFLRAIPCAGDSVGVVSCLFDGYASDEMGKVLNERGVACRAGLHCAPDAHRFLDTFPAGTVRFSVGYFTSEADFTKLRATLDEIEDMM